jgi:cation diffusion facilitator CzcD-associated flavoprotein CzcO
VLSLGPERERYAGKRIAFVGSGHSAFNALLELATLADEASETQVTSHRYPQDRRHP